MRKTKEYQIAHCEKETGEKLLLALQKKFGVDSRYQFQFNTPYFMARGISTEHEFHYFDAFCSGFLLALNERKED